MVVLARTLPVTRADRFSLTSDFMTMRRIGVMQEFTGAEKRRLRAESFADHYSQARQFYLSQTEIEQGHIASAFTFELSKVETPAIREVCAAAPGARVTRARLNFMFLAKMI